METSRDRKSNLNIEVLNDGRAVMFASLNNEGESLWLIGVGTINNNIIDFEQLTSTSGATFGNQFDPDNVIRNDAGQAQITFNQCNQAILSYDFTSIETNEIALLKDLEIPSNECGSLNKIL